MKQVYIINENHPKLLLFFAGWAADETPFKQYHPKDTDYMIATTTAHRTSTRPSSTVTGR